MTNSVESTTKTTVKYHRSNTRKKFNQIPNWLSFKIFNAKKAVERLAWATLGYLNSLPDWIDITPDYLIEKSENSRTAIYEAFAYLEKMGHLLRIKYRDDKGRVVSTEYNFYLKKNGWLNTKSGNPYVDNIKGNNAENNDGKKNDATYNKDLQRHGQSGNPYVDDNIDKNQSSYNKNTPARASNNNTRNNTVSKETKISGSENRSGPRNNSNPPSPLSGADLFCYYLTSKERQTLSKGLINTAGKFIPDNEIRGVIERSRIKGDQVKYLNGVIRNKKTDSKPRQYQTKPPSGQAPPAKPQKSIANKEKIVSQFEDIDSKFEKYTENLSKEEKIGLIENIVPRLSKYTINRCHLISGVRESLIEYYLGLYQIRTEIVEYVGSKQQKNRQSPLQNTRGFENERINLDNTRYYTKKKETGNKKN